MSINHKLEPVLACGQMGRNTSWGRCKRILSLTDLSIGDKGTTWHFCEDKLRFTGVPEKYLCRETQQIAVTPLVPTLHLRPLTCKVKTI